MTESIRPQDIDYEALDAAASLWEAALDLRDKWPALDSAFNRQGTAHLRWCISSRAHACLADYERELLENPGFDGCFDWDFVPDWLTANLNPTEI